jgi:transketolase
MGTAKAELREALRTKANLLRIHSIRTTTKAGSGHPTTCLSAADLVAALFFYGLRADPTQPQHPRNDRVVFSKGHAAPLLYAAWAEAGAFPVEHLDTLREFESDLEGHPTPRFAWHPVATGSLGQGLSIAAGMALGLDSNKVRLAMRNENIYFKKIYRDLKEGSELGVNSTPTFMVVYKGKLHTARGLGQLVATLNLPEIQAYLGEKFEPKIEAEP